MKNRVFIGTLGVGMGLGLIAALVSTALDPSWLGVILSGCALVLYTYWTWDLVTSVRRVGLDRYVEENYRWRRG